MKKRGGQRKYDDPRAAQRLAKKKYRGRQRLEKQCTNNALVTSYRCKQCGLEVKTNLMSRSNPSICIWCAYDNELAIKRNASSGNRVTTGQ